MSVCLPPPFFSFPFSPLSRSLFLLFFSLLSLRVLLAGGRDETEKVLASSGELALTDKEKEMGEGREVT